MEPIKLEGCTVACSEGVILVTSDRDAADRFVWTPPDAEIAARILRHVAPKFSTTIRELASIARLRRMEDREGAGE